MITIYEVLTRCSRNLPHGFFIKTARSPHVFIIIIIITVQFLIIITRWPINQFLSCHHYHIITIISHHHHQALDHDKSAPVITKSSQSSSSSSSSSSNLVPRALFPGFGSGKPKAREKRPGDEVASSSSSL